ncbi:MAG: ankyrin repeat domain-containing protein [Victivallales bacterium]|nr:ankyrin repeat domain-containing protein [Victivallales bacterium]
MARYFLSTPLCALAALAAACVNQRQMEARNELRNSRTPFSRSAFMRAVSEGDAGKVSLFLEGGMDTGIGSGISNSLILATSKGDIEIVQMLLDHGADVDPDGSSGTPLCIASADGNIEIMELLISRGANVNYLERDTGPLFLASRHGHGNAVRLLLDSGARIDKQTENTLTSPLIAATLQGHGGIVSLLVDAKADPRLRDNFDRSALDYAVFRKNADMTEILLSSEIKYAKDDLHKALVAAIYSDNPEACQKLISQGAGVNSLNASIPLLSWAISLNHAECAELLIKAGADLDMQDNSGMTPLDYAIEADNQKILSLMSSNPK